MTGCFCLARLGALLKKCRQQGIGLRDSFPSLSTPGLCEDQSPASILSGHQPCLPRQSQAGNRESLGTLYFSYHQHRILHNANSVPERLQGSGQIPSKICTFRKHLPSTSHLPCADCLLGIPDAGEQTLGLLTPRGSPRSSSCQITTITTNSSKCCHGGQVQPLTQDRPTKHLSKAAIRQIIKKNLGQAALARWKP
jgi:hypothetical protein